jgi:hypothetical protein
MHLAIGEILQQQKNYVQTVQFINHNFRLSTLQLARFCSNKKNYAEQLRLSTWNLYSRLMGIHTSFCRGARGWRWSSWMELLDVQPREEEELLDGEVEQQGRPRSSNRDGQGGAATCRAWPGRSCSLQRMSEAEQYELVDGGEAREGGGGAAAEPTETKRNQGGARSHYIPHLSASQVAKRFSHHPSARVCPPYRFPACARPNRIPNFRAT